MSTQPVASAAALSHQEYRAPAAAPGGAYPGIRFDVGALLGSTFQTWVDNLGPLIGLCVLAFLPMLVVAGAAAGGAYFLTQDGSTTGMIAMGVGGTAAAVALMMAALATLAGSFLMLEERVRHEPRTLTVVNAFKQGFGYAGRAFFGYLLVMLPFVIPALSMAGFAMSVGFEIHDNRSIAGMVAVFGLTMLPMIYFVLRLSALLPALVVEDLSVGVALQRSLELTRGRVGTLFVTYLLFGMISFVAMFFVALLGIIPILGQLVGLAFQVCTYPLSMVVPFILYAGMRTDEEQGRVR